MALEKILAYTDGSINTVSDGSKIGSWGFNIYEVMEDGTRNLIKSDADVYLHATVVPTIARVELLAIHNAISFLVHSGKYSNTRIELYSDSQNSVKAFNEYMPRWKQNADKEGRWIKTNLEPVENQDLYEEVEANRPELARLTISHVKAHAESELNNEIDSLVKHVLREYLDSNGLVAIK